MKRTLDIYEIGANESSDGAAFHRAKIKCERGHEIVDSPLQLIHERLTEPCLACRYSHCRHDHEDITLERRLIVSTGPTGLEFQYTIVEIEPNRWLQENGITGGTDELEDMPDGYSDEIVMLLELA